MKKVLTSIAAVALAVLPVSGASAYFTSSASSDDNTFQAGSVLLQVANDTDADGDADQAFSSLTTDTWDSPTNWVPYSGLVGDAYDPLQDVRYALMLRDAGTADFESVMWDVDSYVFTDGAVIADSSDMGDAVFVLDADYDQSQNGPGGDSILAALAFACDTESFDTTDGAGTVPGADGLVSVRELYDCMSTGGGTDFDLEDLAGQVLPGSVTNPVVGGMAGTGRQLMLTFRFHPVAGNDYQNDDVEVDFEFTGASSEI